MHLGHNKDYDPTEGRRIWQGVMRHSRTAFPTAPSFLGHRPYWRTSRSSETLSAVAMRAMASRLPGFFPFSISDR